MSDMTPEQSAAMDLLGEQANDVTRAAKADEWRANIVANREFFSKGNPDLEGCAVFVIGAGPSLEKNVEDLKAISGRGMIVVTDAALRFVLSRGVQPEFCMMIDGSIKMAKMIEGCDTSKITLITTTAACPEAIAAWKGPRFFVTTPPSNQRKYDTTPLTRIVKATKDLKEGDLLFLDDNYKVEFEGIHEQVMCGGNVSTSAHHFAFMFLKAQVVIFAGMDYSWTFDSQHYAGSEHQENVKERTQSSGGEHPDVNGGRVLTNISLLAFKRWHEQLAQMHPGSIVNATEGGILGVKQDGAHMDYVEFLTLKEAVAKYAPPVSHEGGRLLASA